MVSRLKKIFFSRALYNECVNCMNLICSSLLNVDFMESVY